MENDPTVAALANYINGNKRLETVARFWEYEAWDLLASRCDVDPPTNTQIEAVLTATGATT